MATEKIKALRGTNDILPDAVHNWQFAEGTAREVFGAYGFREIRTPIFELTGLFIKNIGETTEIVEKEMYSFKDKKGRDLSLRPEGTACVVRALIEHSLPCSGPGQKLFYIGPMFRYERPQEGRSRQFHQIGAETIGGTNPYADFELICLLSDFLATAGLRNFNIQINNVGSPECKQRYTQKLLAFLEPSRGALCPDCQRRMTANPLRILDCKVPECKEICKDAPGLRNSLGDDILKNYETLEGLLRQSGIAFSENDRLVRGLDYYTETVYEVSCPLLGAKDAIAGGGRYNNLVENLGGAPTGAAGFGIGIERLLLALEKENALPAKPGMDVFVAYTGETTFSEAGKAVRTLRQARLSSEILWGMRPLKAQFKAANGVGARFLLLIGEEEMGSNQYKIKNMESGQETLIPAGSLAQWAEATKKQSK